MYMLRIYLKCASFYLLSNTYKIIHTEFDIIVKKMVRKQDTRKNVVHFYEKNHEKGKAFTYNLFKDEGVAKSTIYDILKRFDDSKEVIRKKMGRPATKMPPKNVKRLRRYFDHKDGVSTRKAASKFRISPSYVKLLLKTKEHGSIIKCRKKQRIPDRNEQHIRKAKTKCRKFSENHGRLQYIIDDESYFTLTHSSIAGNDIFYSSNIADTPASVKFTRTAKYEKKLMVWLAFSARGISDIYIAPSGMAINSDIYIQNCLEARLIPFINAHHLDGQYIFWPDLASSHYSKKTQTYLEAQKVNYVAKKDNPANVPECRPIERFWAELKKDVYWEGWEAQNLKQLERRIRSRVKNFSQARLDKLFRGVRTKIRSTGRHGVIEST